MKSAFLIRARDLARIMSVLILFAPAGIGHAQDAAAVKPTVHTVVIEGMKFAPEVTEVRAGDSVLWINKDVFPHTVVADAGAFHSREIPTGGSWKMKAGKKGTFAYVCSLHPTMKGTLIVK
jgi:plastocyanin